MGTFNLYADFFTRNVSSFNPILKLRHSNVHGSFVTLSLPPGIVNSIRDCEDCRQREVLLHVRHDTTGRTALSGCRRLEGVPETVTRVILEQIVGKTSITVMETKDVGSRSRT